MGGNYLTFTNEGLPVVSLKQYIHGNELDKRNVVKAVMEACETVGCFFIADHGVDLKVIENCFNDARTFFALPVEEKLKTQRDPKEDRGYVPFETQNVHAFMGRRGYPNDPVEKICFGPGKHHPVENKDFYGWYPNVYPERPKSLKKNVDCYLDSISMLVDILMQIFSMALSMPPDFMFKRSTDACHSFKMNYYPILDTPKPNQDRFGEHTDSTAFTVLCQDDSKNCLMVRNVKGEWVYANGPPGTFFVNLGECMARWTNDKWVATPHKVVFPPSEIATNRISFLYFVVLNTETVLECIPSCLDKHGASKYEPVTFQKFASERMNGLVNPNAY